MDRLSERSFEQSCGERLIKVASGLRTEPSAQRFVGLLFIAFLPAAVLGLMFHSKIKALLFNPITVATSRLPSASFSVAG